MVYWPPCASKFSVRACSTTDTLVTATAAFLGILAHGSAGRMGDPRGSRPVRGTRKGSIISEVLLAGMQHSHVSAVLERICWSLSAERGHFVWDQRHTCSRDLSSHVARMIDAQLIWTLEFDSLVGAFPFSTGRRKGRKEKETSARVYYPIICSSL